MACRHQYHDYGKTLCWKSKRECPYSVPNEKKCEEGKRLNAAKTSQEARGVDFNEN